MRKMSMLVMGCVALSAALLLAGNASASAIIADNFNGGTPGTSINGQTTQYGGATWVLGSGTTANYTYVSPTQNDITSYGGAGRAAQGSVAIGDMLSYGSLITLKADMYIYSGDNYVGLGFFTTTNPDWNNINQPQFRLMPNGDWTIQNITGGTIANFDNTVSHKIMVTYEINNDNVSIYVDGALIKKDQWIWRTEWNTNIPTAVGFRLNDTGGSSRIDNFVAYVPEPMTLGLLGMGFMGLLRRKK